tara:strand:- start:34660 stop:34890 length:231 start_codon:yes stop_codon:yes gene_type:complete
MVNAENLNAALLDAHDRAEGGRLAELYHRAASISEQAGEMDQACFYFTHAYVFALQEGLPMSTDLHARLKALGREE